MESGQLEIREMELDDLQHALRLSMQAGWNQNAQDWRRIYYLCEDSCFAGKVDGQLVATGSLVAYENKCGWIGMMLVDEKYRKRGYGSAMLNRLVRTADEMELEWVGLDATDMGEPLYRKKGFRPVGGVDRWKLQKPHRPIVISGIREYDSIYDEEAVRKLDWAASGMERSDLLLHLYLDARRKEGSFIVCDQNGLLGFGCSRPRRTGPQIGPVVAASPDIGAAIVSALLERANPGEHCPVLIDVPRGSGLESWLIGEGFEVTRRLTRMVRGYTESGNPQLLFAIAGFEYG
jgi:GNAT superfamily N-acetyltransferase